MYTSFAVVALGAFLAAEPTAQPTWLTDYRTAQQQSASAGKPIAVVLGNGAKGYQTLAQEATLPGTVNQTLASGYICVYLDTTTPEGKKLADAFQMPSGRGLVISDRTGQMQAFRHEGTLPANDLNSYLRRYQDPNRALTRTETAQTTTRSFYEAEEDKKPEDKKPGDKKPEDKKPAPKPTTTAVVIGCCAPVTCCSSVVYSYTGCGKSRKCGGGGCSTRGRRGCR